MVIGRGRGHYRAEECHHDTIASLVRIYTFYNRLTSLHCYQHLSSQGATSIPAMPQEHWDCLSLRFKVLNQIEILTHSLPPVCPGDLWHLIASYSCVLALNSSQIKRNRICIEQVQ